MIEEIIHDQKVFIMLEEINILNLGIIEKASLPFTEGLTVITGETGAGKTMVLSALHLLLGKRANSSMVKNSSTPLSVEGVWNIEENESLKDNIEKTGAVVEDGQIFINRTVKSDGKSRAVVGGKSTPASVLQSLGENLVNIHGQSDQIRLKNNNAQREALDKFAGKELTEHLEQYKKLFKEWKNLTERIEDVKKNSASRKREINALKRFVEEYERINPYENEDVELSERIDALSNIDAIRTAMTEAYKISSPENDDMNSLRDILDDISRKISSVSNYDKDLLVIEEKANSLISEADDLVDEIESYIDSLDSESIQTLYELQDREIELKGFIKKNGNNLSEIIEYYDTASEDLKKIEENDQPIEELEEELKTILTNLSSSASKITQVRAKYAKTMEKAVDKELKGLSMAGSSFCVVINETDFQSTGRDEIEFKLLAKGGKEALPISKAASGGELSRIMLSLEVVLADPQNTGTFVFDEVDSGVGGKTAIEIGKRLSKLSKEAQVIVVTHLPQVAAYADNHLKVVKEEKEDSVNTVVEQLNKEQKIEELTRMLSGMDDSELGKSHAKEMIQQAEKFKKVGSSLR